ncbi:MAG TPA: NAD-dependent epimerase/dehydratase family protein, partial [Pirellulales bacterium]|nr:NAD-dependent epimerase/dehydratase family protein [Pirellulales bacterium]
MNCLVTGAGGFLGLYLVEQLAARGDRVRAVCRRQVAELDALGVETVLADLRDAAAIAAACEGMDAVFHVAGVAGIWGP